MFSWDQQTTQPGKKLSLFLFALSLSCSQLPTQPGHVGGRLHLCGDDERLPVLPRRQRRLRPAGQNIQGCRHSHWGGERLSVCICWNSATFLGGVRPIWEVPKCSWIFPLQVWPGVSTLPNYRPHKMCYYKVVSSHNNIKWNKNKIQCAGSTAGPRLAATPRHGARWKSCFAPPPGFRLYPIEITKFNEPVKITKSSLTNPCFQARAQRRISAEQALRHRYFRWETAAYGYMSKQTYV